MFTANYSDFSSPASTPNFKGGKGRQYYDGQQDTPELASTTPLVPPPSQPFGSSAVRTANTGVSKLRFNQNASAQPNLRPSANFGLSTNTQDTYGDSEADYTQDMMDEDYTQYTYGASTRSNQFDPVRSLMTFSTMDQPAPMLRSSKRASQRLAHCSTLPSAGNKEFIPGLIRDMRQRLSRAEIENDPDDVIVTSEQIMQAITQDSAMADDDRLETILADAAKDLEDLWEAQHVEGGSAKDEDLSIGPGSGATPFEKARFLAILLLRLYNYSETSAEEDGAMSMPQIMLDWLNDYHSTIEYAYAEVVSAHDESNVTASDMFWDLVECLVARGKFDTVREVLSKADFSYALKQNEDGFVSANYTGLQLQTITDAVTTLRQVLEASPTVQSRDFQTNGPEWSAYRRDVESALEFLRESTDDHDDSLLREAEEEARTNLMGKDLPYDIFQHLQTIYHILLGSTNDLMAVANDWLEASFYLTIWWNGSTENKVQQWSFDVSKAHNPDQTGAVTTQSYLNRLKDAFLCVTDPLAKSSSQIEQLNPQSDVELAIAAILQGDMPSALSLIQTQSLCITATLAELGSWSGWVNSNAIPDGLDEGDLMVLTHGTKPSAISKDQILEQYAHELFNVATFATSDGPPVEGWELAISVMSRCDSKDLMNRTVQGFLGELQVTDMDRAKQVIQLCTEFGMKEEAQKVSEQFGDYLVNTTNEYGSALLCYAKSGAEQKVRQLVDLLNSYCLVQSKAYPAEDDMDIALKSLVSNPKQALSSIAEQDPDAVEILQFYLVGYACLRRLYTTRDATSDASMTGRKKAVAKAVVAAINSAADCIYGGLYDETRQSAIQVDGLLTLLGEATALTADQNEDARVLSSEQLYSILAAIEDLQTVDKSVFAATESCLSASIRQFNGSSPPSPHDMLKKSMSSGTNSNFSFSMMGSDMLAQSSESIGAKSVGSAVMVGGSRRTNAQGDELKRTWDWRSRYQGQEITGKQILESLRKSIAKELSIANLEDGL